MGWRILRPGRSVRGRATVATSGVVGVWVPRGRYRGYDFRPDQNSLVHAGVPWHKGSEVNISNLQRRRQLGP